jgi:transcription termination factor NusB
MLRSMESFCRTCLRVMNNIFTLVYFVNDIEKTLVNVRKLTHMMTSALSKQLSCFSAVFREIIQLSHYRLLFCF